MSIDEQDLILGRLIREKNENRQRVAALEAKLLECSAVLKRAGELFEGYVQFRSKLSDALSATSAAQTAQEARSAVEELSNERDRSEQLKAQIEKFGLKP